VEEMEKLLNQIFAAYERMSELTGRRIMNFDVYPLNKATLLREVRDKIKERATQNKIKTGISVPESELFKTTNPNIV
jgi:CBS-domain-containing membrane protein